MKKKLLNIFFIVSTVLVVVGCSNDDIKNKEEKVSLKDENIIYSNISDEKSIEGTRKIMEGANMPKENIDRFFNQVIDYNETIKYLDLTKDGFKEMKDSEISYDTVKMMKLWEDKKGMFIGNNCRLTSFDLMEGLMSVKKSEYVEASNLFMDLDAIEFDKDRDKNDERYINFKKLYGNIPTKNTKDRKFHLEKFQKEIDNRGIKFDDDLKISHIAVVFHDTLDSVLFIGHAGVLIDDENGLLFLEKLNFAEPYQAIKFSNRLELNNYLMNKYDVAYNQEEARPFIMENNHVLEGNMED